MGKGSKFRRTTVPNFKIATLSAAIKNTKNTLDNVMEALDSKIDKRLDAFEINAQKERFNTGKSPLTLKVEFRRGW